MNRESCASVRSNAGTYEILLQEGEGWGLLPSLLSSSKWGRRLKAIESLLTGARGPTDKIRTICL
jgi:hypothetical protein